MRIAIDADLVGKDGAGNETYLRGIVSGLSDWLDPSNDALLLMGTDTVLLDSISTGTLIPEIIRIPRGRAGDLLQGRTLSRARADSVLASYNAPILFGGRKVTIVHDVSFRRVPDTYPRILRRRIALSVARSVRVSSYIVTGSHFSRRELLACYPMLSEERVVVAYGAPDHRS